MESKAQKAARGLIEVKIKTLIRFVEIGGNVGEYDAGGSEYDRHFNLELIYKDIEEIDTLIKEYGLDNKLLHGVKKRFYDALMKYKAYNEAALFAKKYGL